MKKNSSNLNKIFILTNQTSYSKCFSLYYLRVGMNLDLKQQNSNSKNHNFASPILKKESRSVGQPVKPTTNWEEPDFDEFDLCMEVTAYINHWQ